MEQETGHQPAERSWLARHRIAAAAGIIVSVIASGTFALMGAAALKAGVTDVGIGYFVVAGISPFAIMAVALRYWTD